MKSKTSSKFKNIGKKFSSKTKNAAKNLKSKIGRSSKKFTSGIKKGMKNLKTKSSEMKKKIVTKAANKVKKMAKTNKLQNVAKKVNTMWKARPELVSKLKEANVPKQLRKKIEKSQEKVLNWFDNPLGAMKGSNTPANVDENDKPKSQGPSTDTEKAAAIFSSMVYEPSKISDKIEPKKALESILENAKKHDQSLEGFEVTDATKEIASFKNDDKKEIIIANVGTRGGTVEGISDLFYDAKIVFGGYGKSKRYKEAKEFIDKVREENPDYKIVVTGHSLGGAAAETYGRENTDVDVITFNSPGTVKKKDAKNMETYENIKSYKVSGDKIPFRKTGGVEVEIEKKEKGAHTIRNFYDEDVHKAIIDTSQELDEEAKKGK